MSIFDTEFAASAAADLLDFHGDDATYTPADGSSATTVSFMKSASDPISEEFAKSGTIVRNEVRGFITNDPARTDHPGIAAPARGDLLTIDGNQYSVTSFPPESAGGLWRLTLRDVVTKRRGESNTIFH